MLKYASTFYNYRNITVWSAPENLGSGKKIAEAVAPEEDVYSFGMLLWELWHEHEPFDNDVALCQQYVLKEDARPLIVTEETKSPDYDPDDEKQDLFCDNDIAKLIRLCW